MAALLAAIVVTVSGVAFADFMGGVAGSGDANTGFPTNFTVSSPILTGGPLYPGQVGDSLLATIQNATGTSLPLNEIVVTISSVTLNPPGSLFALQPNVPPCTTSDYALQAPFPGVWTGGTNNGGLTSGQTLTWNGTGASVPSGDYVVGGVASPLLGNAFQAPLDGLKLVMLNLSENQNACQGASVQVTVSVNAPVSSGGGPSNAASFVVTKSATPSTVFAGSSTPITYTLTAQNTGGTSGTVFIGDPVPSGTTLVSGSNSCPSLTPPTSCSTSVTGSTVQWTVTNVPAGESVAVTFEVTANPGDSTGTISNTAYWTGPGCTSPVSCPSNSTTTKVTAPTPLLITASSTTTSYGTTPTVTPEYTPPIGGTLVTPPTCASMVSPTTVVGTYTGANTCSGASDPAYVITYAPGTAVVDGAPLTITASSGSFTQGGTPPTITAQYSGFLNGDTVSSLTTRPSCSTTATSASTAGKYPSTCTGAADPNYVITYVPGSITVNQAPTTPATSAGTTPVATSAAATSPTTSASTSPSIAFTGALLSDEWIIGVAALLLGSGLVVIARWRRRKPQHAAK